MRQPPCKDCEKRCRACHDTCPEYQDFRKYREEVLASNRRENLLDEADALRNRKEYMGYKRDLNQRMYRKRHGYTYPKQYGEGGTQ